MLDDSEELETIFRSRGAAIRGTRVAPTASYSAPWQTEAPRRIVLGDLHCDSCGGPRKMNARALYVPETFPDDSTTAPPVLGEGPASRPRQYAYAPTLLSLLCSQCAASYVLLTMGDPFRVLILPDAPPPGAERESLIPRPVAFYLEQARRSRAVGAFVAAMPMYRAALEHVLYEQGFTVKMLGAKVDALATAVTEGTAPSWARDLDPAYLKVIKDLGNASIHPNDGSVEAQEAVVGDLILQMDGLFDEILETVYEAPGRRQRRLDSLKRTADELSGRGAPETSAEA